MFNIGANGAKAINWGKKTFCKMATVKVKFRPSSTPHHEGSIYYQIIHNRSVRQLSTGYRVYPHEWDTRRSIPVAPGYSDRLPHVMALRERIRWDVERISRLSQQFEAKGIEYTSDELIEEYRRYSQQYSLFNYMENIITRLRQNGNTRTAEAYKSAISSYRAYSGCEDIMLDRFSAEDMEMYQAWLRRRGVTLNTVSFYCRIFRAVYNRAVYDEIIENRHPFRHVYTGVDKTVKRALPLATICAIKELDLSKWPAVDYARNMFMMSFYLRGMSFVDMAFLRKNDLKNGYISYRRRKTGQRLIIAWTAEMQHILDQYPENASCYLLPIIRNPCTNENYTYRNVSYNINHNLRRVATMMGIDIPLTLYVARHSWASAAKANGIPLAVISEGMGHDSETTTRIYLASLDTSVVDRANALIISSIQSGCKPV